MLYNTAINQVGRSTRPTEVKLTIYARYEPVGYFEIRGSGIQELSRRAASREDSADSWCIKSKVCIALSL
jgi:hypothetical protein